MRNKFELIAMGLVSLLGVMALTLTLAFLISITPPAAGDDLKLTLVQVTLPCGPIEEMLDVVDMYNETVVYKHNGSPGVPPMIVTENKDIGSFTVVMINPEDGLACFLYGSKGAGLGEGS